MPYQKYNKICSIALIIISFIVFLSGLFCIAGGGVLNDLYGALEEIQELEKNNLLNNPPETISAIAKRELQLVHDSKGLIIYIHETDASLNTMATSFFISLGAWVSIFLLKIYLKIQLKRLKPKIAE
jgi:hypothetical protein